MARVFGRKNKPQPKELPRPKLDDADQIEQLQFIVAEQAQVLDAQSSIIRDLTKELSETMLQVRFVMRYFKFKIPRAVSLIGSDTHETKTLEELYFEKRGEFMRGLVEQAMRQEQANGQSLPTPDRADDDTGHPGGPDDAGETSGAGDNESAGPLAGHRRAH